MKRKEKIDKSLQQWRFILTVYFRSETLKTSEEKDDLDNFKKCRSGNIRRLVIFSCPEQL